MTLIIPSSHLQPLSAAQAMVPTRLVLARTCTVFDSVLKWAPSTCAVLKPSQLLPLQASCRLLSVGIVDHAKHREPSGKKLLSEKKLKRHFVDHRRVLFRGGSGGSGMSCFHSEPRKEFGGPDGGDGGNGGHIILRGMSPGSSWGGQPTFRGGGPVAYLVLHLHSDMYQGFSGEDGGSKNCFGRGGATLYIQWQTSQESSEAHTRTRAWASASSGISSAVASSCMW
nr:mitochondrial ribosome-associated GTPase 2 isoform X12 [Rattus norvegicus]